MADRRIVFTIVAKDDTGDLWQRIEAAVEAAARKAQR